jgi:hypothetical protein
LSRKPRSIEKKPVVEGLVDLDLGLTEEKSKNGLGLKIGATAGLGVAIVVIRGTLLGIRVWVDLEAEKVHSQSILYLYRLAKVKKKPTVVEKPVVIRMPIVDGWVRRR